MYPIASGRLELILLLGGCLLALAACGAEATPQPTATGPPAATQTVAPGPSPAVTPGEDGELARVSGTVISESDVAGQPDTPLAGAAVIVMPLDALATMAGLPPGEPSDQELRFLSFTIDREVAGMSADVTDAQGHYELALPAGEYGLCLAYGEGDAGTVPGEPELPLSVRGCGRLVLQEGQTLVVDVSSGFGEILLEEGGDG